MRSSNVCSLALLPFCGDIAGIDTLRRSWDWVAKPFGRGVLNCLLQVEAHRIRRPDGGRTPVEKTFVIARLLKLIQPEIAAIPWGPVEDPPFTVKTDGGLIRGRHQGLSDDGQKVASRSWILNARKSKVPQSYLAAWTG